MRFRDVHILCQPGHNNSTLPTTDLLSLGVTAPPAPVPKPNYGGDLLSLGVNEPQPVIASPPNQSSGANELLDAITTIHIGGDQSVSGNISSLTTSMGTPNRQQAAPSFPNQELRSPSHPQMNSPQMNFAHPGQQPNSPPTQYPTMAFAQHSTQYPQMNDASASRPQSATTVATHQTGFSQPNTNINQQHRPVSHSQANNWHQQNQSPSLAHPNVYQQPQQYNNTPVRNQQQQQFNFDPLNR